MLLASISISRVRVRVSSSCVGFLGLGFLIFHRFPFVLLGFETGILNGDGAAGRQRHGAAVEYTGDVTPGGTLHTVNGRREEENDDNDNNEREE